MLILENVRATYGHSDVLKGVSLEVPEGAIVALVGANGAGKTTTLRAISGLVRVNGGAISFLGRRLDGVPTDRIVGLGISHVPEGRGVFPDLTVEENLKMGGFSLRDRRGMKSRLDGIYSAFPRLKERRKQPAETLSGGEQQMLALGRALISQPKLLLMDEPSMGLAPLVIEELARQIVEINRSGTTILLVEQNVALALALAYKGYVLSTGQIVLEGLAHELRSREELTAAYLGGE